MKRKFLIFICTYTALGLVFAHAQIKQDVPLMRPEERDVVDEQSLKFNQAIEPILSNSAKSTVEVWSGDPRNEALLSYGTVIMGGTKILTKFSEIEPFAEFLYVKGSSSRGGKAEIQAVYTKEDLAVLEISQEVAESEQLSEVQFSRQELEIGQFLVASRPNGKMAGFGVVGVLERNLRESDQAHIGFRADPKYDGQGVKIADVQPEYGAAKAGMRKGDIILSVDGRLLSGLQELKNALSGKEPGDRVKIRIDSSGKEREVEVILSNRPVQGQLAGGRIEAMDRMGGEISLVRSGYSQVVESDMKIASNRIGGPVLDLEGKVVGITIARAGRTKTYVMRSGVLEKILASKSDSLAEAREEIAARKQLLAKQQQAIFPNMRSPQGKPLSLPRMRRHLSDIERLRERLDLEMEGLGIR